jgi:Arm DNA-binding domain
LAPTKLTDAIVKRLPAPNTGKRITYDSAVAGFGCRVYASGARTFVLNYRTHGRHERRITIGSFPDWSTAAARGEAAELKKIVDRGGDPLGDIQATRAAPTVGDVCDRFLAEYLPPSSRPLSLAITAHLRNACVGPGRGISR